MPNYITKCWSCQEQIESQDHYCRHCGIGQGRYVPYYYKQWAIIFLALGFGPFALWWIWNSPVLSKTAKWINTLITGVYTYFIVSSTIHIYKMLSSIMSGVNVY